MHTAHPPTHLEAWHWLAGEQCSRCIVEARKPWPRGWAAQHGQCVEGVGVLLGRGEVALALVLVVLLWELLRCCTWTEC